MNIINQNITQFGYISLFFIVYSLARQFADNGFADLKIKANDKEIMTSKAVLYNSNPIFKKLIVDEKFENEIELADGCSIEAFLEIEKYYSGGFMHVDTCNVCDIFLFCIYYNEKTIKEKCEYFIKNHLNEEMMLKLFEITHILNNSKEEELIDFKMIIEEYLNENNYKLLKERKYLKELKIEEIEMILKSEKLLIKNENWLLEELCWWYEKMIVNINDISEKEKEKELKEIEEEFLKLLLNYIDFSLIDWKCLSSNVMMFIEEHENYLKVKLTYNNHSNKRRRLNDKNESRNENEHIIINLDEVKNPTIEEIILKYYKEEEKEMLEEREIEILERENDLKEILLKLISRDDYKLIEICIMIIIDLKMKIESIIIYIFINIISNSE